jgi:hypothetical protein
MTVASPAVTIELSRTRIPPNIAYPERQDRGLRPSWRANKQFVDSQHREIWEMTKEIPGWQEEGDSYKLYEMGYFAGDVIVEIGTYGGKSAVCELLGALANPDRTRVAWYGIDNNRKSVARTEGTLKEWNLEAYCTLFYGKSAEFFAQYSISPTMVFVDANHSYDAVKQDIKVLSRVLEQGVPVLFHDYLHVENEQGTYGVKRACDEWDKSGEAKFLGVFGGSALLVTARTQKRSFVQTWARALGLAI